MRHLLAGVCCITIAASLWLAAMSVILRHPGYAAQVGLAVLFAAQSLVTLTVLAAAAPGFWIRLVTAFGAAGLAAAGGRAVAVNLSGFHFEGYAVIIGAVLILQGALTLWSLYISRIPPSAVLHRFGS